MFGACNVVKMLFSCNMWAVERESVWAEFQLYKMDIPVFGWFSFWIGMDDSSGVGLTRILSRWLWCLADKQVPRGKSHLGIALVITRDKYPLGLPSPALGAHYLNPNPNPYQHMRPWQ